jgi:hypothetical protein
MATPRMSMWVLAPRRIVKTSGETGCSFDDLL